MRRRWPLAASLLLASCSADAGDRPDDVLDGSAPIAMDAHIEAVDGHSERVDARSERADARTDARPEALGDGAVHDGARLPPRIEPMLPTRVEPHLDEAPHFNLTRPVELIGRAPIVVWANGGCLRSDFTWAPMFERWAAAGYVVLSLSGADLFGMLGTTTSAEHKALMDWVVAQDRAGPYAGKLDLTRIVVAGNSCGGVTALEVAAMDRRAAAVFVLSGSSALASTSEQVMKAIQVPVGYVVGGAEDLAGANASNDYALLEGPAMIVHRREGDHITVSTDANVLRQTAELALAWMELALFGSEPAYQELTSANVCDVCTPGDWRLEAQRLEELRH